MAADLALLLPEVRSRAEALVRLAADDGTEIRIVSTLRTCDEQDAIYAQGRTAPGNKVSNARGCVSWHVWGRAFDVVIMRNGKPDWADIPAYARLGELGESTGLYWGGRFKDYGHFEYHPGLSIGQVCPDPDKCRELTGQPAKPAAAGAASPWLVAAAAGVVAYLLARDWM